MARYEMPSRDGIETETLRSQPDAFYQLGLSYASGRDVPMDLIEAHKWFNLAALAGNSDARRYRNELSAELTKSEVAQAQKRAREYMARRQ